MKMPFPFNVLLLSEYVESIWIRRAKIRAENKKRERLNEEYKRQRNLEEVRARRRRLVRSRSF